MMSATDYLPVDTTSDIGLYELLVRQTLRDTLLGVLSSLPATPGIAARLLLYPWFMAECGDAPDIRRGVTIKWIDRFTVGDDLHVSERAWIDAEGGIQIGDCVQIGPHTCLISYDHKYSDPDISIIHQGKTQGGIEIGDDVWIGANVTIVSGVTIGDGAVVAAGATVVNDVPSNTVVGGVPAETIAKRGGQDGR